MGNVVTEQVEEGDFIPSVIRHPIATKLVQRLLAVTNEEFKLSIVQATETAQLCDLGPCSLKHGILQHVQDKLRVRHLRAVHLRADRGLYVRGEP